MIFTNLDLDRHGKHLGHLQVPYSHDLAGWTNILVPIASISNGKGPTVLVIGGNHGDEFQGQIAIWKLMRKLVPEMVSGRLLLIPSLNYPAAKVGTRLSPIDGMNMNRAFPGDPDGGPTSQLAYYLSTVLFPLCDVVIDIHSGGRSMIFEPCAHMHLVADPQQRKAMIKAMLAWNTDFAFLYADIAGDGLLPVEAENQGKIVVTTELGGSEAIPAKIHKIAYDGLRNVLIHHGVLQGQEETRKTLGKSPTIVTQALSRDDYLLAPESGVFEIKFDLGSRIEKGDIVGVIHHLERPDRPPEPIQSKSDGYLMTIRAPCLTQQGDCVAVVAQEVELASLLEE